MVSDFGSDRKLQPVVNDHYYFLKLVLYSEVSLSIDVLSFSFES